MKRLLITEHKQNNGCRAALKYGQDVHICVQHVQGLAQEDAPRCCHQLSATFRCCPPSPMHNSLCPPNCQNGVSFNWAHKARVKIPNAYLQFQERAMSGVVEFYLNGLADMAIEVMLDATQTVDPRCTRQSQDIDDHQERFRHGKYTWKSYVLFNFAMGGDKIVLPRDTSAHDKVYTFVRSTNTLYRGIKPLRSPAIPNLSGGSRSFSTVLRTGCAGGTKPAQYSMLRHFMTCVRRWY